MGLDPISLATSGIKMGAGIAQMIAGKRILKKNKLPEYNISPEFDENIKLAQGVKNMGMPSEQYSRSLQDISRNLNFGMSALGNRRAAVAGIGNLVQRSMDATNNVNVADANMRRESMMRGTQLEMGARRELGLQKLAKQQWEKMNPYLRKLQEGQAMVGAGMQNFVGAANDVSQLSMVDKMYGKN